MTKLSLGIVSIICGISFSVITVAAEAKGKQRARPTSMTLTFQTESGTDIPEIKGEIEILAWSWGLSTSSERCEDAKQKEVAGLPRIQDISMTKFVGLDSPKLMSLLMKGYQFPKVTLKTSSERGDIIFTMKNAKLSSLSTGGSGGEDRFTENISVEFKEIQVENSETSNGKTVKSSELIKVK